MLTLKLSFILYFYIGFKIGKAVFNRYGSVFSDNGLSFKINAALAGIFVSCVALAAFIRLSFDIELLLPQIIRIHATHFKWYGVESLFACLIGFASGLYHAEPPNLRRKLYITSVLLFALFLYFEHFYTRPIYELCRNRMKDGFVIQTFQSSCGPSSLANLFILHGKQITENEAARAARTRYTGTTGDELALAAAALDKNIYARYFKMPFGDVEKLDLPCVLSFNEEHFVTYIGRRKHLYEYVDPSIGICLAKKEDLTSQWDGKALYIYPEDFNFELKKGESDERLKKIKKSLDIVYKKEPAAEAYDGLYDDSLEAALRRFTDDYKVQSPENNKINPYVNLLIYSKAYPLK